MPRCPAIVFVLAVLATVGFTAGCSSLRQPVPFEQGSARYAFDIRAEPDLSRPGAVGVASVTDLRTKRRVFIDRFEAPEGQASRFSATDAETGARFDLAVTVAESEAAFVATVHKNGLLIASEQGRRTLAR